MTTTARRKASLCVTWSCSRTRTRFPSHAMTWAENRWQEGGNCPESFVPAFDVQQVLSLALMPARYVEYRRQRRHHQHPRVHKLRGATMSVEKPEELQTTPAVMLDFAQRSERAGSRPFAAEKSAESRSAVPRKPVQPKQRVEAACQPKTLNLLRRSTACCTQGSSAGSRRFSRSSAPCPYGARMRTIKMLCGLLELWYSCKVILL